MNESPKADDLVDDLESCSLDGTAIVGLRPWAVKEIRSLRAQLAEARKALEVARDFIDPDRSPPRMTNREVVALIDAAIRSQAGKAAEPDAWMVGWFNASGSAGIKVYTTEDDARRAAKNLEAYSTSETTADVLPLYAAPPQSPPRNNTWQPIDTAPRDGTPILAANKYHDSHPPVVVRWYGGCDDPHWCDAATAAGDALYFNPNYFQLWQPVPLVPRDEQHG